jgi:hypothetical protein
MAERKVIQIAAAAYGVGEQIGGVDTVYALCDDGSVWWYEFASHPEWSRMKPIPQGDDDA